MKRIFTILETLRSLTSKRKILDRRNIIIEKKAKHKANSQLEASQPNTQRKLLIDVSVISRNDARTGIQRVVRAIFSELIKNNPPGFSIHPIAATLKEQYRYISWAGIEAPTNKTISINEGDIFLGLDLCTRIIPKNLKQLSIWKEQGGHLYFIVYDILPVINPDWFPIKMGVRFSIWLKSIAILADATICISRNTQHDLQTWMNDCYGITPQCLPSHVIPMGSDIEATKPSIGLPPNFINIINKIKSNKSALMVGTLEPRKGHNQILDAFEALWEKNSDVLLVIVGVAGWKTEKLQRRLINHSERNNRLFWINDASDEALSELYSASTGLIIASFAEGFGLPILEALAQNKPILARDLSVFRFMNHGNIEFFTANDGKDITILIDEWLSKTKKSLYENPTNNEFITDQRNRSLFMWKDCVDSLLSHLGSSSTDPFPSTPTRSQGKVHDMHSHF
ncbi:MAG: glycosyltransferase family 4 protein [Paludibacteraceae bacterium]